MTHQNFADRSTLLEDVRYHLLGRSPRRNLVLFGLTYSSAEPQRAELVLHALRKKPVLPKREMHGLQGARRRVERDRRTEEYVSHSFDVLTVPRTRVFKAWEARLLGDLLPVAFPHSVDRIPSFFVEGRDNYRPLFMTGAETKLPMGGADGMPSVVKGLELQRYKEVC